MSILIFSLQHLLPGDPALIMAGEERDPAVIEQIRQQYRLDRPVPVQYVYWVKGVLSGDFGESLRIKVPVRELIAQKLPVTMQLAAMAIVIAFLIGIPAGIVSAVKKGTAWDYGANLKSGGLDLIERLLATDIKAVQADPKLKLSSAAGCRLQAMCRSAKTGAPALPPPSCPLSCWAMRSPRS